MFGYGCCTTDYLHQNLRIILMLELRGIEEPFF